MNATSLLPQNDRAGADTRWRKQNLGALLFAATDLFVDDKLRVLRADGFGDVSATQLKLFHHLDLAGTRLTALAARANLTKQSMIELVDRAEAMRLVERAAEARDLRAKTVHFTEMGLKMRGSLERGIAVAEDRVRAVFGMRFFDEVQRRLIYYVRVAANGMPPGPEGDFAAAITVGHVFARAARHFSRHALSEARNLAGVHVPEVLLALFRNLELHGGRLTEIAALARMTKQSMRELVSRAEALGFVEREQDFTDRRAKVIAFTKVGLAMLDDVRRGLIVAEAHFDLDVGADFAVEFKARLAEYTAGTQP